MPTAKSSVIKRFTKNLFVYGLLFIVLSLAVDWYRKPTEPAQFATNVLYDIQQQRQIIAQLSHEKPMLLYFWGSWCNYCKFTSPAIQQFVEEHQPVLSVALKSGSVEEVKAYLAENGYTFPAINDQNGAFSKSWDIQATPTILIIKDGKVVSHTTGVTSYWGLKIRTWLANLG